MKRLLRIIHCYYCQYFQKHFFTLERHWEPKRGVSTIKKHLLFFLVEQAFIKIFIYSFFYTFPSPYISRQLMSVLFCFVGLKRPVCVNSSVVSNSLRPHGLQPSRLLSPWNSPGKNTGVGSQSLLQGSSRPRDQIKLQADSFQSDPLRKPIEASMKAEFVLSSFSALLPFFFLFLSSSLLLSILQYLKGLC